MKTMIESESEWNQYFVDITMFIGKRLTPSKLRQYINLMKLFRSGRIEADKLIRSLLILFEEDECLSQMFNKLMETEIREMKKNDEIREQIEEEAKRERKRKKSGSKNDDEVEEGEIREKHRRCRCRIRVRHRGCEIGREEADLPIKKRSKHRLEPTGPVLGRHEFVSEINQKLLSN